MNVWERQWVALSSFEPPYVNGRLENREEYGARLIHANVDSETLIWNILKAFPEKEVEKTQSPVSRWDDFFGE